MNNKKAIIKFVFLLVIFTAFIGSVYALEEDFSLFSSKKDLTSGNCRTYTDLMTLSNDGDVTSTYFVSVMGSGAKFASIAPSSFALEPKQSKVMYNYMTFPCDSDGKYDININVKTLFGKEKTFERTVTLQKQHSFEITADRLSASECGCTPTLYKFTVYNKGAEPRTYSAQVLGDHSEFAEISEKEFMLAPNDKITLFVYITEPCGFSGNSFYEFKLTEKETNYEGYVPFYLNTKACYEFATTINENLSVCNDEVLDYPIYIKSQSDIANNYYVSSDMINLPATSIFMWGGESIYFNGTFREVYPTQKIATLSVLTERGQIQKDYQTKIDVQKCHSGSVSFKEVDAQGVSCYDNNFAFTLKNDGTKKEKYNLTLIGPEWTNIVIDSAVELNPSDSKDYSVNAKIPCDSSGKYQISLISTIFDREISDKATMNLDIITINEAFGAKIIAKSAKVDYNENKITIGIENTGSKQAKYDISIDYPSWIKSERDAISIASKDSAYFDLISKPNANATEGTYAVTISAKVSGTDTTYSKTINVKLEKISLYEKLKRTFFEVWSYWMYILAGIILALLIIAFLVWRRKKKESAKDKIESARIYDDLSIESMPIAGISTKKIEKGFNWKLFGKISKWFLVFLLLALIGFIVFSNFQDIEKAAIGTYNQIFGLGNKTISTISDTQSEFSERIGDFIKNEIPKTKSIIYINTSGLKTDGNMIKIKAFEKVTVPITIYNNDEVTVNYNIIFDENTSWISADQKYLSVPSMENKSFNINIFADKKVEDGNYEVAIQAIVFDGNKSKYTEGILLQIEKETPFGEKYMYYFVGGIIALLLLILAIFVTDRIRKRGKIQLKEREEKIFIAKPIETLAESPLDKIAEKKLKKKWILFIFGVASILFVVVALIYAASLINMPQERTIRINESQKYYSIANEKDTIKLVFANNKTYDILYFVENTQGLIKPEKKAVVVFSKERKNETFEVGKLPDGTYSIKIDATKKDRTTLYSSIIFIDYKNDKNNTAYWIIAGALIYFVLFIIFLLRRVEAKKSDSKKELKTKEISIEEEIDLEKYKPTAETKVEKKEIKAEKKADKGADFEKYKQKYDKKINLKVNGQKSKKKEVKSEKNKKTTKKKK